MSEKDDKVLEILEGLRTAIEHVNNSVQTLGEIAKSLNERVERLEARTLEHLTKEAS